MTSATETGIRITGLDQLVRTLRRAEGDIQELKDAHARAGEVIASMAARLAPRLTGNLAGSIRPARQVKRARVMGGSKAVPYAPPIHWGWPARGIRSNPFVSEAAQMTEPEWLPIYLRDIQQALDRVKGT